MNICRENGLISRGDGRADELFFSVVYCFVGLPLVVSIDVMIHTYYIGTPLDSVNDQFVQKYLLYYSKQRYIQECFLESAPMLCFQVYLFFYPNAAEVINLSPIIVVFALLGSIGSVMWNVMMILEGAGELTALSATVDPDPYNY
jgi:hypothetical protein